MIDIHTHILPGVDDGAPNFEESMQLLRHAAKAGTREIILTPHCAPTYGFWNFDGEELDHYFRQLWRAVDQEGLDIRLHPGMEVLYEGKEEMADFIACDAHDLQRRDSSLRGVEEYIRRQYGKDKVDKIFKRNPRAIIEDRVLAIEKG